MPLLFTFTLRNLLRHYAKHALNLVDDIKVIRDGWVG